MHIKTMIVDDQADVRLLIRITIDLANDGLEVTGEASSGEEALTAQHFMNTRDAAGEAV